jgi:adenosylcobinamide-phosphate synthase
LHRFVDALAEPLASATEYAFASTAIASHMLYHSVRNVIYNPSSVRHLVSRDTDTLSNEECYKAAIESYAENLSDGVVAPIFYLSLFGLEGAFVYKAVNTLDSMTGYLTPRYARFGAVSARLDDAFNFIPARLTALLIILLHPLRTEPVRILIQRTRRDAPLHASINAGYPIAAMAHVINVTLGGPTRYFGRLHDKARFGPLPPTAVYKADVHRALALQPIFDKVLIATLSLGAIV